MRWTLLCTACFALLLGVAGAAQWSTGARSMAASDALIAKGEWRASAVEARRAAEATVPGSPYPARAYARLETIAHTAELAGRFDDAGFAWRAIRSSAVATWPAPAGRGKVALADQGILRVARAQVADVPSAPETVLRAQLGEP